MEKENAGKMMNWVFFYISVTEMKDFRGEFHEKCETVIGVRKLHQVILKPGRMEIYLHRFAYMCSGWICGNVEFCDTWKENPPIQCSTSVTMN